MTATTNGNVDIVKFLTPYTNFRGQTIFHYAITSDCEEMIEYVFNFCPDINEISYVYGEHLSYADCAIDRPSESAIY